MCGAGLGKCFGLVRALNTGGNVAATDSETVNMGLARGTLEEPEL